MTAIQTIDATVRLERRGDVIQFGNVSMTVQQAVEAAEAMYQLAKPFRWPRATGARCIECGDLVPCTCEMEQGIDEAKLRID